MELNGVYPKVQEGRVKELPRGGSDPLHLASELGLRTAGIQGSSGQLSPSVCPEEHLSSKMHSDNLCVSVDLLNTACRVPLCTLTPGTLWVLKSTEKAPRNPHEGQLLI